MSDKRPSLRQLECFSAIARTSNFRKAAQQLGISQPALTQQINELELTLSLKLFDRSRAGTLLTPKGRTLLAEVNELIEMYQHLTESARDEETLLTGKYRVGVTPAVAANLLPQVFNVLHQRYPHLVLSVKEYEPARLEQGLAEGEFDLILTLLPVASHKYRIRPLFTEPVLLVMHEEHALVKKIFKRKGIEIPVLSGRDLHQHTVIGLSSQFSLQRQLRLLCDRYGAQQYEGVEANSLNTLRLMLQLNMGVSLLPALHLNSVMGHETNLRNAAVIDEQLTRTHVAVWRMRSASRQSFQMLSFEIKAIALELAGDLLEEVNTDEYTSETW